MSKAQSEAVRAYWEEVVQCLVEHHQRQRSEAEQTVEDYRRRINAPRHRLTLLYHEDPFTMACEIAWPEIPHLERIKRANALWCQQQADNCNEERPRRPALR